MRTGGADRARRSPHVRPRSRAAPVAGEAQGVGESDVVGGGMDARQEQREVVRDRLAEDLQPEHHRFDALARDVGTDPRTERGACLDVGTGSLMDRPARRAADELHRANRQAAPGGWSQRGGDFARRYRFEPRP